MPKLYRVPHTIAVSVQDRQEARGGGLQAWHGTAVDRRAGQAARLPEAYRTAAEEVLEPGVALLSE